MERKLKLASDELRIVWGEVYIPDVPDTDNEFMDAEGIREMAYKFMKNLRLKAVDSRHNNQIVDEACVVESFIARKGDPDFVENSWVVGVHVPDDEMWSQIKSGKINGFSMEAMVTKTHVALEIEVPPVLSGMTQKSGEADSSHDHEFTVAYNEEGNFLGGRTSIVAGHFHTIKRGTVTEETGGHRHRFAHVDLMKQVVSGTVVEKADISSADLETAGKKLAERGLKKKNRHGGLAQFVKVHAA